VTGLLLFTSGIAATFFDYERTRGKSELVRKHTLPRQSQLYLLGRPRSADKLILTDALQAVMRMLITSFSKVQSHEPPTL
jgi:hypothetical protein